MSDCIVKPVGSERCFVGAFVAEGEEEHQQNALWQDQQRPKRNLRDQSG
jgi:hypothetical protein